MSTASRLRRIAGVASLALVALTTAGGIGAHAAPALGKKLPAGTVGLYFSDASSYALNKSGALTLLDTAAYRGSAYEGSQVVRTKGGISLYVQGSRPIGTMNTVYEYSVNPLNGFLTPKNPAYVGSFPQNPASDIAVANVQVSGQTMFAMNPAASGKPGANAIYVAHPAKTQERFAFQILTIDQKTGVLTDQGEHPVALAIGSIAMGTNHLEVDGYPMVPHAGDYDDFFAGITMSTKTGLIKTATTRYGACILGDPGCLAGTMAFVSDQNIVVNYASNVNGETGTGMVFPYFAENLYQLPEHADAVDYMVAAKGIAYEVQTGTNNGDGVYSNQQVLELLGSDGDEADTTIIEPTHSNAAGLLVLGRYVFIGEDGAALQELRAKKGTLIFDHVTPGSVYSGANMTGFLFGGTTSSPGSLVFAHYPVGATSGAKTLTITNPGTLPTTTTPSFSGPEASSFKIKGSSCPKILDEDATCKILVQFHPKKPGKATAVLTVGTSQPGSKAAEVAVSGTGVGKK